MQEKQRKGLCFRCDEKFGSGHYKKWKELQILWVLDEEELVGGGEHEIPSEADSTPKLDNTEDTNDEPFPFSLPLSSMVGLSAPHSLKIRGKIQGPDVVVLVDLGAHNFISTTLVELGLPKLSTKEFRVVLGIGDEIKATGVCRQVKLHLAALEIMVDFFLIPLGSSVVILGYQWLASLGESHMNWGAMTIRFKVGETRIQLQGDPSLCKTQVSL